MNCLESVVQKRTCHPLEGENGQVSDHKIVLVELKLPRPKSYSWDVHEYLQITEADTKKFLDTVNSLSWTELTAAWPDQDKMAEIFTDTLSSILMNCFRWKRVRRRSTDKPWISDALRDRIRRRTAVFWLEGRSELWKRLDRGIKKTINYRKNKYEERMALKLEQSGRTGQWYSIYKYIASDDMPDRWNEIDLDPNQTPIKLADKLASHFLSITNTTPRLSQDNIPTSNTGSGMIPQLDKSITEKLLRSYKKTNSRVQGDIPRDLVNPCTSKLAEALKKVYNASFLNKKGPKIWKVETIIPIPNSISPGSFDDVRPISMTTLWSKILESLVAGFTLDETSSNWRNDQYGGRKGSSTDHVLVNLRDKILTGLDQGFKASVISAIDFSKSFSRCSF